ncbi:MAG: nucleoside hydrolase [Gemmatimonadetes bacterium]|nr:nucleoside hydrolase [Gemmatimonadota bacterium]
MREFIVDTDTASDDAVALIMALRWPDVEVLAITTVSGNIEVANAARNALITAELCGSDVPVYVGSDRPLRAEPHHAHFFHGSDGLGDRGYPEPQRSPEDAHAVDALIATIRDHPGVTLVTLGPLTNIATALCREPDIATHVSSCVIMGGAACTVGNITPAAEYNLWVDPDASNIVFSSGLPIVMVGWELCRGEANLDDDEMDAVRAIGTELAGFAIDCNVAAIQSNREWLGDPGLGLPDPVAMAVALDPQRIVRRASRHHVEIEHTSELTRGMSVVDQLGVRNLEANATVVWEIDVRRFKEMLRQSLS